MHPVFAIITGPEIIIVGAIIVLLFGAERLPKLARSMGEAKKHFEAGTHGASVDASAQPPGPTRSNPPPPAQAPIERAQALQSSSEPD